jgi:hypothetical protein
MNAPDALLATRLGPAAMASSAGPNGGASPRRSTSTRDKLPLMVRSAGREKPAQLQLLARSWPPENTAPSPTPALGADALGAASACARLFPRHTVSTKECTSVRQK